MNLLYLPKHISEILNTPVICFVRNSGGLWQEVVSVKRRSFFLSGPVQEWVQYPLTAPALCSLGRRYYYALVPSGQYRVLIGPVQLTLPLSMKLDFPLEEDFQEPVSSCDLMLFLQSVLLGWNLESGCELAPNELIAANCRDVENVAVQRHFSQLSYENRELGHHHNGYSQEVRMLGSIENGDLQMLEQCQKEAAIGDFGILSSNSERSIRNVCIAAIVLASRAAIRGGLHPEEAFSLCDAYILNIERLPLSKVGELVTGAQLNFTALVRDRKNGAEKGDGAGHPLVKKCENYIYDHLHGRTSLKEAAQALGVSSNYLSTLFKKYKGVSFSDFVMEQKVALTKELLVYSPMAYRDIAATLGFASQSHLGEHFKRLTGMTPIQFRNRYAVTESQTDSPKV